MASKVFPYLVCVFALLSLFSLECDAFGNGAIPGKRSFQEKNSKRVEMDGFAVKRQLCDAAERLGC